MKNKTYYQGITVDYNKVPSKINNMKLSMGAYALFHYLASVPEEVDPSRALVGRKFGVTRQTAAKWFDELEASNIIKCYQRGGLNRVAKYEFTPPKTWVKNEQV